MKHNPKIKLKKGDIALTGILLAICGVFFVISFFLQGTTATVTVDGKTVYETDISGVTEKKDIVLENGVTVTVEPGCIYFSASPCKGKDCIHTGKLTKAGDCAVCLPEKTVIKISSGKNTDIPDAIT